MAAKDPIRVRAAIKGRLTTFKTFLEGYAAKPDSIQLKLYYDRFKLDLQKFEEVQNEIEQSCEETNLATQLSERENYEKDHTLYRANAERLLNEIANVTITTSASETTPLNNLHLNGESTNPTLINPFLNLDNNTTTLINSRNASQINFPKLELPKFSGDVEAWPSFSDTFRSSVHNDPRFTDVQKLIYLRSCLTGKAAAKIASLAITDVNYSVAWDLLDKRYNDLDQLIESHIKAFFELPQESVYGISEINDRVVAHLRALQALKTPFHDAFPIYAITSKLTEKTQIRWKEHNIKEKCPSLERLLEFLYEREKIIGGKNNNKTTKNNSNKNINYKPFNKPNKYTRNDTPSVTLAAQTTVHCNVCQDTHYTSSCSELIKLSIPERSELIVKLKLCTNCLRNNHAVSTCRAGGCKTCGEKYHTLLHEVQPNDVNNTSVACFSGNTSNRVLLSTALIDFTRDDGTTCQARVLLDSCSQTNFVSKKLANQLGVNSKRVQVPVTGINNSIALYTREINAKINSRFNKFTARLPFLVRRNFGELLPAFKVNQRELDIPSNITLADPQYYRPGEVDGLLGAKIFYKLLCQKQRPLKNANAVLQKTHFGWVVAGEVPVKLTAVSIVCNYSTENTNEILSKFWEIEEVPNQTQLSEEETFCEEHYASTTTRDSISGKYIVRLPFRINRDRIGESHDIAMKRFLALERNLNKDPELKLEYSNFLKQYLELGHMSKIEHSRELVYLPHHGVLKRCSLTTKLRVVFDASSKTSSGLALNDILCVGPVIQEDLLSIILRFRSHTYVITADIEKMYRQIVLHKEDRRYQNILWRENKNGPIKSYQLNTITYGTAPASFLATRSLLQLAEDEGVSFPNAARVLRSDFYMDDLITGARSLNEAKSLRDEIMELTKRGGLPLRQWAANHDELIRDLENNSKCARVKLSEDDTIKTLGLYWNARNDSIIYSITNYYSGEPVNKRTILGTISRLFDPLGLLGPVIINAKMMLQRMWQIRLDWDEPLPSELHSEWITYREKLNLLNEIKFNRKVIIDDYESIEIHGFCDASERAYGACIYVRSSNIDNKTDVNLLCAKSKVTPLKTLSLPRLQLCSAMLLTKLLQIVKKALRLKFSRITLWSDSTIALTWIKTPPHTLKTFAANRVAEIQKLTEPTSWYHVPSECNPADLLSRGCPPERLISHELWQKGPSWLRKTKNHWPKMKIECREVPECKVLASLLVIPQRNELLERYSSFDRLKRVMALMLRFANNCRKIKIIKKPELDPDEIKGAGDLIVKLIQHEAFPHEIDSIKKGKTLRGNLAILAPFLDKKEILRVGGRLKHAEISFEKRHQALLPKNYHLTDVIIRDIHQRALHAGAQTTLNILREEFWLIDGVNYIKSILHKCVNCRRVKPTVPEYLMGDLPKSRVNFSRPFLHTGIDYCGPFFIKEKRLRNRNKVKIYIAVFVCFSTKALHLELVEDLTSDAFLSALKRFFARRGKAAVLYSDNATNFVGAKRFLKKLNIVDANCNVPKQLSNTLAAQGIKWQLIPPRAPHFGELWEAAVKSVKRHLLHVLKNTLLSYGDLLTSLTEIEAILNSRPLVPLSADPNDLNAITPAHFIIGESLASIPENDLNLSPSRSSSWHQIQLIRKYFWKRWQREYLNTLSVRKKWHFNSSSTIKIGDLVMLKEDNLPPLSWPLARIIDTHPGSDGVVRVVSLKTVQGVYKRAIKSISPLPVDT